MTKIHYKSDFKVVEAYPGTDRFTYHYYTDGRRSRYYDVSLAIGNCRKDDSDPDNPKLVVMFSGHDLYKGHLHVLREMMYDDTDMPDTILHKVSDDCLDVELVDIDCEVEDSVPVAGAIAAMRGEKGEKGEKGDQGEKGEKGDKGDPGDASTEDIVAQANAYTDQMAASILEECSVGMNQVVGEAKTEITTAYKAADVETLSSAKKYADQQDEETLNAANAYAYAQDATMLNLAKSYADQQDTAVKALIPDVSGKANKADVYTKTETDAADVKTLGSAMAYADEKSDSVKALIPDVSGKADAVNVYTKSETDALVAGYITEEEVRAIVAESVTTTINTAV